MADRAADRIGIGQEDHVAVLERAVIAFKKATDEAAELADDHPAFMVGDQRKGIALFADAGRHGGAHERRVHLDPRIAQSVFDDVERDRIDRLLLERGGVALDDGCGHGFQFPVFSVIRMLPTLSTVPVQSASISVVESISMTMAGPGITSPASSFDRS